MFEKIKNNKNLIYIIIPSIIVIVLITLKIITKEELIIDKLAYNVLVTKLRSPSLTNFMKVITKFSDTISIIILAVILTSLFLYKWKDKNIAKIIPCSIAMVASINQLLKFIFQRERPNGYRLIEMTGYSFPSGHAMISMAFYGLLIYIIQKKVKNKPLRLILIIINIAIIILVGISRIYLGVHYLSDVITGYLISLIYLVLFIKMLKKYNYIP